MPMMWEINSRNPCEDDENDDVFCPDDEDFLDATPCVSEACFGDWMSASD